MTNIGQIYCNEILDTVSSISEIRIRYPVKSTFLPSSLEFRRYEFSFLILAVQASLWSSGGPGQPLRWEGGGGRQLTHRGCQGRLLLSRGDPWHHRPGCSSGSFQAIIFDSGVGGDVSRLANRQAHLEPRLLGQGGEEASLLLAQVSWFVISYLAYFPPQLAQVHCNGSHYFWTQVDSTRSR